MRILIVFLVSFFLSCEVGNKIIQYQVESMVEIDEMIYTVLDKNTIEIKELQNKIDISNPIETQLFDEMVKSHNETINHMAKRIEKGKSLNYSSYGYEMDVVSALATELRKRVSPITEYNPILYQISKGFTEQLLNLYLRAQYARLFRQKYLV